ncbi:bifunctional folylpolyglutamate synthase/dihydrofolate synthase [Flavisolibacter tropicus]|uniref:Dihydrofolate synthase/folylpolyglutamate synthase n=1 Tax=Flavisolibacter tropicus TaxID=1492898 RepID=A0A172TS06_9BACT|nr:folylpolyglutamate synthase/dihydrofolate synthase family protein [Flavisolibacter tropicus]ANE49865.1 dihydrofolate synthase [Flavisolibacter tropicus]
MTYNQTIEYLFTKLPMFSRIGSAAFKKDLTNIKILCDHLGNPERQFKSIHIGGTNGKGSTSHMLASVLQTAGYKTGLYTSPHLYDFRERIKIDGQLVPEDFVIAFVEQIKPLVDDVQPSFFEITVAMAFSYFAQQKVDVAVIEVGLGGRLDSTNIIHPEVSVITNIGWDHMNILGDTLKQIAIEKAGIIKPATSVVIGEKNKTTSPVFQQIAANQKAPIFYSQDRYAVYSYKLQVSTLEVTVADLSNGLETTYITDLPGIYQTKNICTVLQTIEVLREKGFAINTDSIHSGLQNVQKITGLGGRWEVLKQKPTVVLEVAHNEDGLQQMIAHLKALSFHQLHLIYGMVKDKEADKVLKLLPKEAQYYFTQAHIPRALPAAELKEVASNYGLQGNTYEHVNTALHAALQTAKEDDLIIVCGSIFLVAEVDKHAL